MLKIFKKTLYNLILIEEKFSFIDNLIILFLKLMSFFVVS